MNIIYKLIARLLEENINYNLYICIVQVYAVYNYIIRIIYVIYLIYVSIWLCYLYNLSDLRGPNVSRRVTHVYR